MKIKLQISELEANFVFLMFIFLMVGFLVARLVKAPCCGTQISPTVLELIQTVPAATVAGSSIASCNW